MEAQARKEKGCEAIWEEAMTPLYLMRTDFTEIPAMEITCKNCKSVTSISLPRNHISDQFQCVGCNVVLWSNGDKALPALAGLMRCLSAWKEVAGSAAFQIGFSIEMPASHASTVKD